MSYNEALNNMERKKEALRLHLNGVDARKTAYKESIACIDKKVRINRLIEGDFKEAVIGERWKPSLSTRGSHYMANIRDRSKTIGMTAQYGAAKMAYISKGLKSGRITVKQAGKMIARGTAGTALKVAGYGAKKVGKASLISLRYGVKGLNYGVKGSQIAMRRVGNKFEGYLNNSDDLGVKAVGVSMKAIKAPRRVSRGVRAIKGTAREISRKVERITYKTGRIAFKTGRAAFMAGRGMYRFGKSVRAIGFKKTSKTWIKAHLKGVGKKIANKIGDLLKKLLAKILFNPFTIGGLILFICVFIAPISAICGAASVVVETITYPFKLIKKMITVVLPNGESYTVAEEDFDVASLPPNAIYTEEEIEITEMREMSATEFIFDFVQRSKEELIEELEENMNVSRAEGYTDIYVKNLEGKSIEKVTHTSESYGLLSNEEYIKIILPIWEVMASEEIGEDYTIEQAEEIVKKCWDSLTEYYCKPTIFIDENKEYEYCYCNGTYSNHAYSEKDEPAYVMIGNVVPENMSFIEDESKCTHSSPYVNNILRHTEPNTEGLQCCQKSYVCEGHSGYRCCGHTTTECIDLETCTNVVNKTEYCTETELEACTNKGTFYNSGIREYCKGHTTKACGGHSSGVTFCWKGIVESAETCDNAKFVTDEQCYKGISTVPIIGCDKQIESFYCQGYVLCYGHKIMTYHIGSKDFEALLDEAIGSRLDELKAKQTETGLTEEEQEKLEDLEEAYKDAIEAYEEGSPLTDEFFEEYNNKENIHADE